MKCRFFLFFGLFFALFEARAQEVLVYATDESFIDIGAYCKFSTDTTFDFEKIKNLPESSFQKTKNGTSSFGDKTQVWLKFLIKNQTSEALYLDFSGFGLQFLDAYIIDENDQLQVQHTGTMQFFNNRYLKRGNIVLKIGRTPKIVYLRMKSNFTLNAQISVSSLKPLADTYHVRDTFNGICMGILFAMGLYNLFLFFSVKERLYFYYFLFIMMSAWVVSERNSLFRHFVGWGNGLGIRELFLGTGIFFTMRFLNTRKTMPLAHKILSGFIVLYGVCLVLDYFEIQPFANRFYTIFTLPLVLMLPVLGFLAYRRGHKSALFYTIAWTILIVCGVISILSTVGVFEVNFWNINILAVGTCIETILLAFALAYRIKEYRDASESAQKTAFQRLQENENLIKEQNKMLEDKVTERTDALQKTLNQLQNTESQLVHSEKMAALGELTAGVAHEINNPVNFISTSLPPLKRNLDAIDQLIEHYESLTPENFDEKLKEIKEYKAKIDFEYTKEETALLMKSVHDGAHRTAEIVKGLRNFSRLDEADRKKASINEGLESTLLLMQSAFKSKNIELIKDLGELPEINCYAGQLNQVFMNILTNAVQAMSEKGTITVKTFVEKSTNSVKISIADNGKGMPEEVKNKIFQPFFTTKKVGEGTGLGLSISYGIVKKHDGQIEVDSLLGRGTTFVISLPID
jgi:two-component system, NtrC family, sensor kinase